MVLFRHRWVAAEGAALASFILLNDNQFPALLFPDRDNTFAAFDYPQDGTIQPSNPASSSGLGQIAQDTLALTGLDKPISIALDENGKEVALDRVSQRKQAWLLAQQAKMLVDRNPENHHLRAMATISAQLNGFFSIWMTVFQDDPDMRRRLIDAFPGTRASGCFDPATQAPISPAPNPDGLPGGGKI